MIEEVTRQQQPRLRGSPSGQMVRVTALGLERSGRLAQLAECALLVAALRGQQCVIAHRIDEQHPRVFRSELSRPLEVLARAVAGDRRVAAGNLLWRAQTG